MNEKEIIKKINQDYLEIINSKEYKLGCSLANIGKGIKKVNIHLLLQNMRLLLQGIRLQKYNAKPQTHECRQVYSHYSPVGKTAIYTALFGGYDQISEPVIKDENCDYFIFTDQDICTTSDWKKLVLSDQEKSAIEHLTATEKNRYFKMIGYKRFSNYKYSIYLDANLEIYSELASLSAYTNNPFGLALYRHPTRDCIYNEAKACVILGKAKKKNTRAQMKKYQTLGMPAHYGMCECNAIVRENANEKCFLLMNEWWQEFQKSAVKRDQLIFPYILWKHHIAINEIGCLGACIGNDGKFRVKSHTS